MSIRRDYTNGSGYVCPTENAAIAHLDKPKERIPRPARHSGVLHEQELNRMSKPTPMQALAQIAEQEAWLAKRPVCADCGHHIQEEEAYYINGEWICERCMDSYRREVTEE